MSKSRTTLDIIVQSLKSRAGERFTANKLSELMVLENEVWSDKKREKVRTILFV